MLMVERCNSGRLAPVATARRCPSDAHTGSPRKAGGAPSAFSTRSGRDGTRESNPESRAGRRTIPRRPDVPRVTGPVDDRRLFRRRSRVAVQLRSNHSSLLRGDVALSGRHTSVSSGPSVKKWKPPKRATSATTGSGRPTSSPRPASKACVKSTPSRPNTRWPERVMTTFEGTGSNLVVVAAGPQMNTPVVFGLRVIWVTRRRPSARTPCGAWNWVPGATAPKSAACSLPGAIRCSRGPPIRIEPSGCENGNTPLVRATTRLTPVSTSTARSSPGPLKSSERLSEVHANHGRTWSTASRRQPGLSRRRTQIEDPEGQPSLAPAVPRRPHRQPSSVGRERDLPQLAGRRVERELHR